MRSFKKTTRHVCIFNFSSVKHQFYTHFQNNQLKGFVHYIDPLLGIRPSTPLGDFRPHDIFPFASIHPPKLRSRWRHWSKGGILPHHVVRQLISPRIGLSAYCLLICNLYARQLMQFLLIYMILKIWVIIASPLCVFILLFTRILEHLISPYARECC